MWDFLFIDNESGEQFFVECNNRREAMQTVWENFGEDADIECIGRYTVEEADILGYDTY